VPLLRHNNGFAPARQIELIIGVKGRGRSPPLGINYCKLEEII